MVANDEGGDDAAALGRGKRLSPTGAQVHLEEEESEASTGMAKKSNKGLEATICIGTLAQPDKEVWLVLLTEWAA